MKDRQLFILDQLEEHDSCLYTDLSGSLGVSTMTIRREVEALARQGVVVKTLRGCRKAHDPSLGLLCESDLSSRVHAQAMEKRAIARTAVGLIGSRHRLYIDGSTTCIEFARVLAESCRGLTVVTNSALVCMKLGVNSFNTIIVTGGHYDAASASFVGPIAEDMTQTYRVDLVFFSTKGFLPSDGMFESSMPTFRIKQLVAKQSAEVVLLVDHTKFGRPALTKAIDISQIHTIVTDDSTPEADIVRLKNMGKRVHVASTRKQSPNRE